MDLALEDLRRAADLFRPVFDRTGGLDGWVSMEVSPLLANDTKTTLEAARNIHRLADRPNLYVKIPGTPAGRSAIEEAIFAGVPVNVTLLFSREQYLAVAEAYMRGLERRIAAGRDPRVSSVASLFVSRWDKAVSAQGAAGIAQSAGNRHRDANLSRALRIGGGQTLARPVRRRRGEAAHAVGKHRHQGPDGLAHSVCRGTGGARNHRHHAGEDAAGVRRAADR